MKHHQCYQFFFQLVLVNGYVVLKLLISTRWDLNHNFFTFKIKGGSLASHQVKVTLNMLDWNPYIIVFHYRLNLSVKLGVSLRLELHGRASWSIKDLLLPLKNDMFYSYLLIRKFGGKHIFLELFLLMSRIIRYSRGFIYSDCVTILRVALVFCVDKVYMLRRGRD